LNLLLSFGLVFYSSSGLSGQPATDTRLLLRYNIHINVNLEE
jgi:hypothetical protein